MSDAAILARAIAVARASGLERAFFCHMAVRVAHATPDAGAELLALAETVLGPVASVERRDRPGTLVLLASHERGGITQAMLREGEDGSPILELDGAGSSVRLGAAGALTRHSKGQDETLDFASAGPASAMPAADPKRTRALAALLEAPAENDVQAAC